MRDLAVSLPSGCRIGAAPSFYTTYFAKLHYFPPTRYPQPILGSIFELKPAGDFAIVGVNPEQTRFPLVVIGRFRSSRSGTAAVPAYPFKCSRGGWPHTVHFALAPRHRTADPDGTYTGSVIAPPAGITGAVSATVVGGGRVLTDFRVAWTCPDGPNGGFELGPSLATGEFIGPAGAVDAHWTPAGLWSAHFGSGGKLSGTFTNASSGDCTQGQSVGFSAALSGG